MKSLIDWKDAINGAVVADYHKRSKIIYVGKQATDEDIVKFKEYLEKNGYEVVSVFKPN